MAYSLLAHLYPHVKGSQEDLATLSLHYLLTQSPALNKVFTKRISDVLNIEVEEILQYSTQAIGEENERPDMSGTNSEGREELLCEMKFYASLTANQPLGYLERLKKNRGKGLLFICPESRITALWFELKKICDSVGAVVKTIDDYCVSVDGINMAIVTWGEINKTLMYSAQSVAESLIPDIKQIEGYCKLIDEEAFIPFKPEELTALNAKKAQRFYTIVEKVTELLLCDEILNSNKKGLRATANGYGFISYIYVNDYALGICYDRFFWKSDKSIETPFWLLVKNKEWEQTKEILKTFDKYSIEQKEKYGSQVYLALKPLTYATEDEVCKDIKNQILKYIDEIDRGIKNENN